MKVYETSKIKNFCLLGHGNSGKTSLAEAMLYTAGSIDRVGRTQDGTSVMDFDPEEVKRKFSISAALASCEWNGTKFNILDTPGYFDFVGEVQQVLRVADAAIIVLSGKSGLTVGAEKAWKYCEERGIPKMIFINKVDDDRVDYQKVLNQLKEKYGKKIAPFQLPLREGDKITGFINVVEKEARIFDGNRTITGEMPEGIEDELEPLTEMINEAVAEQSEELMDKYFSGEPFTLPEMYAALRNGVAEGDIVPVLCGSAYHILGMSSLLNAINAYFPAPNAKDELIKAYASDGSETSRKVDTGDTLSALVFKTVADPYVGKLSYFKVFSGVMTPDTTVYNLNSDCNEKIGKIYTMLGKKQVEVKQLNAGDIGTVTKLSKTKTGDTLSRQNNPCRLEGIDFAKPNMELAVVAKKKGDDEKIAQGLLKLMDEDKTFAFEINKETRQQLLKGLGDQHIDVIVSKLKNKFGVEISFEQPKVPYRETIKKKVKVEGKHKKQSGGHGQYGHVWIEFEPSDQEGLVFEEKIFGGSVPKGYFPAVEKGLQEAMEHGVLAGYPMVGLKATLVDGSYHDVDSSEMAFKMAASLAYKAGMPQASPVILEPIGHLKVYAPDSYTGDIIGDINKRRGQMLGMEPVGDGVTMIEGEVPMAEMHSYSSDLRSMTQARGEFEFEFERYQEAPQNVIEKIIAEAQK
ncbi:MAG TPA: elongation factor G [Candidatus Monoglobus merdigallinarum]|uniref:Elongation factor G n=1 Tax=Candidatus Monoglobus merdigallinarum TaxID=2838698 RepID=A0A9D1PPI2_9FIRM|nr:elongation factor G [Candidatus Monoglobus merdigallinarum]